MHLAKRRQILILRKTALTVAVFSFFSFVGIDQAKPSNEFSDLDSSTLASTNAATGYLQPGNGALKIDPSKCSTNPQGMATIAIGKTAFRHPIKDTAGASEKNDPISLGCPNNPLKVAYLGFADLPEFNKAILYVYVAPIASLATEYNMHTKWYGMLCNNPAATKDNSVSGLQGCIKPKDDKTIVYKAANFHTPDGDDFIISCNHFAHFWKRAGCEVVYNFNNDISIKYNFYRDKFPLEKIVDLDREIRRRLNSEIANNNP